VRKRREEGIKKKEDDGIMNAERKKKVRKELRKWRSREI